MKSRTCSSVWSTSSLSHLATAAAVQSSGLRLVYMLNIRTDLFIIPVPLLYLVPSSSHLLHSWNVGCDFSLGTSLTLSSARFRLRPFDCGLVPGRRPAVSRRGGGLTSLDLRRLGTVQGDSFGDFSRVTSPGMTSHVGFWEICCLVPDVLGHVLAWPLGKGSDQIEARRSEAEGTRPVVPWDCPQGSFKWVLSWRAAWRQSPDMEDSRAASR